jgi:hypothetical protein
MLIHDDYSKFTPSDLIDFIQRRESDLKLIKATLERKQASCQHDWPEPKYAPIVKPAYEHPGDPPGTMGVDWRGPVWIPRQETPRWSRKCRKCLKVEETYNAKDDVRKVPVFK